MDADMATVRCQLEKFVETRNGSGFASNLQFQTDLEGAGLKLADLGQAFRLPDGSGYQWFIPDEGKGNIRLIEQNDSMWIETI